MNYEFQWKEFSLGEVIELKRGYDLPKDKWSIGKTPIVSSSGISDFHAEAMVKGPGVVTGRYGTIGEVFYITDDFWRGCNLICVNPLGRYTSEEGRRTC